MRYIFNAPDGTEVARYLNKSEAETFIRASFPTIKVEDLDLDSPGRQDVVVGDIRGPYTINVTQ